MLAAFRFKNFRSFQGEAELSLYAHTADKTLPSVLIDPAPKSRSRLRLLPAVAIYGANAAGKTNVLLAFSYMFQAVLGSHSTWRPDGPAYWHAFASDLDKPASFEVEIFLEGDRLRYGFSVSRDRFIEEWLYSYPQGRPRLLLERKTSKAGKSTFKFGKSFGGESRYLRLIGSRVRPNSLFISAAAQDNHDLSRKISSFFNEVLISNLVDSGDDERRTLTSLFLAEGSHLKNPIMSILRAADPAIRDVSVKTIEGKGWDDHKFDAGRNFFSDTRRYQVTFAMGDGNSSFDLPLEEQSRGVQKMYGFAGEMLGSLMSNTVVIVDELESSIHPHVARILVDLFQDQEYNPMGAQLIFTTHDTSLLDQSLLRRDQIWFVEKESCCSSLYSLLEFSPRKDADLERGYLRGRFGAIPVAAMPPPLFSENRHNVIATER